MTSQLQVLTLDLQTAASGAGLQKNAGTAYKYHMPHSLHCLLFT